MKKTDIIEELWEKSNGVCALCGKQLIQGNCSINHIFPYSFGGSNKAWNLNIVCDECNQKMARVSISERDFQRYLLQLLEHDKRFIDVQSNVRWESIDHHYCFDITFYREENKTNTLYILEAKVLNTVTSDRMGTILHQLDSYKKAVPEAHIILAIPILLTDKYRDMLRDHGILLWDRDTLNHGIPDIALPICAAPDKYDELIMRLSQCPPGSEYWQVYQKLAGDILSALFCPPLNQPKEQNADSCRLNIRDYILPNYARKGPWKFLFERYKAEFIPVDAKNSSEPVGKDEILQIANYLSIKGLGMFGIILSRFGPNQTAKSHILSKWQNEDKMIVILDDLDIKQMLLNRQEDKDPCWLIIEKIEELRGEL